MPIDLHYDREKNILYVTIGEQITQEEFSKAIEKITHSDEFPPDVPTLWDLRTGDFTTADSSLTTLFIEIRKKHPERGKAKIALIVSDDLAFGMSRMYELKAFDLPQEMRVFRDYAEGEQWIIQGRPS